MKKGEFRVDSLYVANVAPYFRSLDGKLNYVLDRENEERVIIKESFGRYVNIFTKEKFRDFESVVDESEIKHGERFIDQLINLSEVYFDKKNIVTLDDMRLYLEKINNYSSKKEEKITENVEVVSKQEVNQDDNETFKNDSLIMKNISSFFDESNRICEKIQSYHDEYTRDSFIEKVRNVAIEFSKSVKNLKTNIIRNPEVGERIYNRYLNELASIENEYDKISEDFNLEIFIDSQLNMFLSSVDNKQLIK